MPLVAALLKHEGFARAMDALEKKEETRFFCRHGLDHALDVARIMTILSLENERDFARETIYLAALLHDIGRSANDAHHDEASVALARDFLHAIGADEAQSADILEAISNHRDKSKTVTAAIASLSELLAMADTLSRPCYRCKAAAECYWSDARRNHTITY